MRGGDGAAVERAARAVANSPLVKTALHGGDPNWGRIAQAVGGGAAEHGAARARHRDRGRAGLRRRSAAVRFDAGRARRGGRRATRSSTRCGCRGEGAETEVFFSDLGHDYVTINAEYTT